MNLRQCKMRKREHNLLRGHAHQLIAHRHVEYFNAGTSDPRAFRLELPDAFEYSPQVSISSYISPYNPPS